MLNVNSISFRGGGESCGSIGNLDSLMQASKFSATSFKSNDVGLKLRKQLEKDTFEKASQNCYDSCGNAMAKGLEFLGAYKNIKNN